MTYKFGSFTYTAGDEPESWVATAANLQDGDHAPYEPFNYMDNLGLAPTSLVLQGYFLSRSNFDTYMSVYKSGTEILAQVQEWDGTERQFFGIAGGQGRESKVGQRKGVYDYVTELICPDPFKYGTELEYLDYASVSTSDTTFTATGSGTSETGTGYCYPIISVNNDSGSPISGFQLYAGDGASSILGQHITTSAITLAAGGKLLLYPIFYDNIRNIYVLKAAYSPPDAYALSSVDLRVKDNSTWSTTKPVATAMGFWPRFTAGGSTIKVKISSGTVKVGMQWRKTY